MRVLVIEDEARLAATLQDLLELGGYTADVRHDGESGPPGPGPPPCPRPPTGR